MNPIWLLRASPFLAIALLFAWSMRLDHLRAEWRDMALGITAAIADVTGDEGLDPDDAAAKVYSLGVDRDRWRTSSKEQTAQIRTLADETERLKKLSAEWREKALVAIAKRDDAIRKLADISIDPGDRADCVAQLRAAEAALDLAFEEGL